MLSNVEYTKRSEYNEHCSGKNREDALLEEESEIKDARQVRAEVIVRAHLALTKPGRHDKIQTLYFMVANGERKYKYRVRI